VSEPNPTATPMAISGIHRSRVPMLSSLFTSPGRRHGQGKLLLPELVAGSGSAGAIGAVSTPAGWSPNHRGVVFSRSATNRAAVILSLAPSLAIADLM